MRRYEFVEGTSNKFWEIELEGESFTARWGKIGTAGQEKTQDFDSEEEARKAHDKLVAEKEKKGYRLVGGDDAEARPLTAKLPSHPEFEEAIVAKPDDARGWQVYADFLIEKGESWGEVIAKALQGKPDTARQKAAEESLLNGAEGTFTWKFGVLEHFDFQPGEEGEEPMHVTLERVLKHPAGHFIRKLTLGLPPNEDTEWHMEDLAKAIVNAGPLPFLQELDLSPDADHMDQPSWRRLGDVRGIWEAAPHLKVFLAQGAQGSDDGVQAKLAPITAPHLERFVFESGGLTKAVPEELGAASLPSLTHLELHFGRPDYGCTSEVGSLGKLLEGKGLPKLQILGLKNSEWEAELIEAVAKSKLLKQLEVVDFSMGVMSSSSTAALKKYAPAFKHLNELNLEDNYFSEDDQQALKKELPNAVFGTQKDDEDPEYRYTTVGE